MNPTTLHLPVRESKPRTRGLTMVIDGGLPLRHFEDVISSSPESIDFVKFGWGTAVVTDALDRKIDILREHAVDHYFGGTLFEKFVLQGQLGGFREFCRRFRCQFVEVSNGTIDMTNEQKAAFIHALTDDFRVISEVGYKDAGRSGDVPPARWVEWVHEDLAAGSALVTLETRESGRSGICLPNGDLRHDLLDVLLGDPGLRDHLLFEAPTTALQAYFVGRLGSDVNLGNIAASSVLGLETLRLGLRADTLQCFEGALL
jgi:phosphosulfolactate synthase